MLPPDMTRSTSAGPVLPLAILTKTKLKPGWLIPRASLLKYFNWNYFRDGLEIQININSVANTIFG
jgi:hypothetical protein